MGYDYSCPNELLARKSQFDSKLLDTNPIIILLKRWKGDLRAISIASSVPFRGLVQQDRLRLTVKIRGSKRVLQKDRSVFYHLYGNIEKLHPNLRKETQQHHTFNQPGHSRIVKMQHQQHDARRGADFAVRCVQGAGV